MAKLVQCVPNFSVGSDQKVIDLLVKTATGVPGVTLVDHSSDASHNRSVFTLVGNPDGIAEAAFQLCKAASENIAGYSILEAGSAEEVETILEGHPHLSMAGNSIEVLEVIPIADM